DNGDVAIPWLTPFYVRGREICLVYQVAGEIFRHELPRPLSDIAIRLEPWIYRTYRNTKIITCSDSTKIDLVGLGLASTDINVVRPGIDGTFREMEPNGHKFESPTIVCISRFMRYK